MGIDGDDVTWPAVVVALEECPIGAGVTKFDVVGGGECDPILNGGEADRLVDGGGGVRRRDAV